MANGKDEYAANGKQVLLNGEHYADAVTPDAASAIAYAMSSVFLAKLPPKYRDPMCPTCKGVGMHEPNCVEGRGTK